MLIVNDEHRIAAGVKSLSKRCSFCRKPISAYPLIMNDDAGFHVFHAACAAALATDIIVDLSTFFIHQRPTTSSLCSPHKRASVTTNKEGQMKSTDLEEIKAALWEQASHPCIRVSFGVAQVMALLRGRERWYPVEAVTISRPVHCPTGACDIEDAMG